MTEAEVLNKFGQEAIAEMITRLQNSRHVNTGALKNSLKYSVTESEGKYSLTFDALDYAVYVDKGRKPGKAPSVPAMENWVKSKLKMSDPRQIKQVAFLVGRKIAKKGIAPTNFFSTTITRKLPQLQKDLGAAFAEAMKKEIINSLKETVTKK